jgi:hypothetical protein
LGTGRLAISGQKVWLVGGGLKKKRQKTKGRGGAGKRGGKIERWKGKN